MTTPCSHHCRVYLIVIAELLSTMRRQRLTPLLFRTKAVRQSCCAEAMQCDISGRMEDMLRQRIFKWAFVQENKHDRDNLLRGVHLLHILHISNNSRTTKLPNSEFYNNDVSQQADLAQEYMIWRHLLVSCLAHLILISPGRPPVDPCNCKVSPLSSTLLMSVSAPGVQKWSLKLFCIALLYIPAAVLVLVG